MRKLFAGLALARQLGQFLCPGTIKIGVITDKVGPYRSRIRSQPLEGILWRR